ncbi:carbohydrate-binding domain-containing protein [Tetragenococcus halophilus]|uniref:carbohydrate-binding domain-containing protein n=1 Tax=Tetragenococcus halophilus TaxID=51669 RepID=UPI000CCC4129|nr:carbohydrate-binding domain-containing protein [Tetragenococcus halophilus]MCO8296650.1 carbohydrate-binding domain-containing protein [Tetragenococcus halophilus]MCT8309683.1 carbohydrate-binding domain-containing protein [Tetragenococcus halophilus]RQD30545.1 carbohydrate-binding domain-containing protein [Tetragenococcus halophilus subsp. halophilus DSM 20339]
MKKRVVASLVIALFISACSPSSASTENSADTQTQTSKSTSEDTADISDTFGTYEKEDLNTEYDSDSSTVELSDNTEEVEGVSVDGQIVTINQGGTYVLSGELTDGQVVVNVNEDAKVHLVLNDVTITNQQGPAILVEQAEKVVTTLASDTTNTLTDGDDYQLDGDETEPDATFYSKEDLVLNGDGELKVSGNYNNGIRSKDDLILVSGEYTVNAKNNALKGKDSVQILDGSYTLTTEEGDGIQSNNSDEEDKGYIAIDGGTFKITSGRDGVQAETVVNIQQAEITIKTGENETSDEESYKGIKAGNSLLIQNGTFKLTTADDSLHSDGDIAIKDGEFTLDSGDDGIHADNDLTIDGGTINVTDSNEGLEASVITINDGDIAVVASDDGLNTSDGSSSDTEETGGQEGAPGEEQADDSLLLAINGGTLHVDAQGDGLDSNGNIEMTGGTVTVDGPTEDNNGALDYEGDFEVSGGTLIAAGSSGMAMNVSDSSSQASLGVYFSETQSAGTIVSLQDSDGNVIATYKPSKDFDHIVISSSELEVDESYTLVSGTDAKGTEQNGYYQDEEIVDGTELGTLTLSDTVTNLSETGETVSVDSMMGGPGGAPNGEAGDGEPPQ